MVQNILDLVVEAVPNSVGCNAYQQNVKGGQQAERRRHFGGNRLIHHDVSSAARSIRHSQSGMN